MTKNLPEPISSEATDIRMRQLMLSNEGDGMQSLIGFDRLASSQRPLVIANACGSWADLSTRFIYAGATSYIGTFWPITYRVAEGFAETFFSNLFDDCLLNVFNTAKNAMPDEIDRLAYAFSGTFESVYDPSVDYGKDSTQCSERGWRA